MAYMSQQPRLDIPAGTEVVQNNAMPAGLDTPDQDHRQNEHTRNNIQSPESDVETIVAESSDSPNTATCSRISAISDSKYTFTIEEAEIARTVHSSRDNVSLVNQTKSSESVFDEKKQMPQNQAIEIRSLTFRKGWRGRYVPLPEQKLRNNLSGMVGYLEFANALDFAANVWNTIPVPAFAAVLMGLGGSTAIILSFFALLDGLKCWDNVKVLRKERAALQSAMQDAEKAELSDKHDLDVKVEVNSRELGQEMVDRFSMDIFMGFSSLVVGVGTLLAIAGANPRIYHASNLLSGYIGNSPSAFWGIGNTLWSAWLFRRASRHTTVGSRVLQDEVVKARLQKRTRSVQIHSFIMGLATLVSAPCGMITATMWQGYPPLVPCILLSKWGNVIWRKQLGYTRFPISALSPSVDTASLVSELHWTSALQNEMSSDKQGNLKNYIQMYRGDGTITAFMTRIGLLEDLCLELIHAGYIKHGKQEMIEVDQAMIEYCERQEEMFESTASLIFQKKGRRALAYRERYLLELLGASVYNTSIRCA